MIRGKDLGEAFWEAYSEEGFIQDTRDGLVIFEENPTPINPVQRKPKTGTRFDRVGKELSYLKFYTGNPEKRRILEIWADLGEAFWEAYSEEGFIQEFYPGNPEKRRILEIWVAENMRVSKPMRTKGK